jgi:hypothetical protein
MQSPLLYQQSWQVEKGSSSSMQQQMYAKQSKGIETSMMLPGFSKVSPGVTGPCSAIKKTGQYKCMKIMDLYKPSVYLTI